MFELRWFAPECGSKRLQYRAMVVSIFDKSTGDIRPVVTNQPTVTENGVTWTEWQNVPTVFEEEFKDD